MSNLDQGSLQYFMARSCDPQWRDFLSALAEELASQMPSDQLRAFFHIIGRRMAEAHPLRAGESLAQLETHVNRYFASIQWGWVRLKDQQASVEFAHACAPLRAAFGASAMEWCGAVLEGMYAAWLKQMGSGDALELRQVGHAEGLSDTITFRLAHASAFAAG